MDVKEVIQRIGKAKGVEITPDEVKERLDDVSIVVERGKVVIERNGVPILDLIGGEEITLGELVELIVRDIAASIAARKRLEQD